mgnify:CR=1 FL=1
MKNLIKNSSWKVLFGLLIVAIISGWFYWFQWRPTEIRKQCYATTLKKWESNSNEFINLKYGEENQNWEKGKIWAVWTDDPERYNSYQLGGSWGWWWPGSVYREKIEQSYKSCLLSHGLKN